MCHVKIIDTDNYVTKSYKYFKDPIYQIHYEFCSIFMRIIKYNLQQQIVFFFSLYITKLLKRTAVYPLDCIQVFIQARIQKLLPVTKVITFDIDTKQN